MHVAGVLCSGSAGLSVEMKLDWAEATRADSFTRRKGLRAAGRWRDGLRESAGRRYDSSTNPSTHRRRGTCKMGCVSSITLLPSLLIRRAALRLQHHELHPLLPKSTPRRFVQQLANSWSQHYLLYCVREMSLHCTAFALLVALLAVCADTSDGCHAASYQWQGGACGAFSLRSPSVLVTAACVVVLLLAASASSVVCSRASTAGEQESCSVTTSTASTWRCGNTRSPWQEAATGQTTAHAELPSLLLLSLQRPLLLMHRPLCCLTACSGSSSCTPTTAATPSYLAPSFTSSQR